MFDDDDNNRVEMSWTDKIEERLILYSEEAKEKSKKHSEKSAEKKVLYYTTSSIAIIIPFLITFLNTINETHNIKHISLTSTILVSMSGIINGLNTFFNYGKKEYEHDIASIRYNEIAYDIDSILTIKRRYRLPADVSLNKFTVLLESLNKYSIGL